MRIIENILVKFPLWSVRKALHIMFIASLGALLIGIIGFIFYMNSLPSLNIWHTTTLQNEFNTQSDVKDFDAYVALETELFDELDKEIYNKVPDKEKNLINRYTRDSLADPKRWDRSWNKSFELPVKNPKMGVLLLHGMSDSPYSLHTQAEYLHKQGVWVVGLRMPGHGTIPSGLTDIIWEDMAAVVNIGMKRLSQQVGEKPIHIVGYSTGAPLALNYTFTALEDSTMVLPSSLIFFSPAIGVSKAAPFAVWQSRIGDFFGLPKLEWNSLNPEYDPFKYNSFAVNAGDQVYRICNEVQKQFDEYNAKTDHKKELPPILSFQSIIDDTVSVTDTVNNLYKRLPKGKHTLVLFDINNGFSDNLLVKENTNKTIQNLKQYSKSSNYQFDLISDVNSTHGNLRLITNNAVIEDLSYTWPDELFSLSHLAMPVPKEDPLYGYKNAPKSPGIQLGHLAVYGESSVLQISPSAILRQRWNPFHEYTKERVLEFLEL